MSARLATTAATSSRASAAAVSSRSDSARCRSRIASGVRWPKSASNTAASASRRPVRRPRWASASDAIDDDGDRPQVQAEEALDGRRDGAADLGSERGERLPGPGDDAQPDEDAVILDADPDGWATQP